MVCDFCGFTGGFSWFGDGAIRGGESVELPRMGFVEGNGFGYSFGVQGQVVIGVGKPWHLKHYDVLQSLDRDFSNCCLDCLTDNKHFFNYKYKP